MTYTIGEMAKKLGVAPSTLRYYDKEGLLPAVARSEGGVRVFQDADLDHLCLIQCLKKTGMSIQEIRQFIDWAAQGDETIPQRLELFRHRREAVMDQIAQLQDTLEVLDFKSWYYETAQGIGTKAVSALPAEQVPERFRARLKSC